jgi:hypothetical protein
MNAAGKRGSAFCCQLWEFSWKTGSFNSKGGTVSSESIGVGSKVDEKGRFETSQKLAKLEIHPCTSGFAAPADAAELVAFETELKPLPVFSI